MKGFLEDLKAGGRPMTDKELAEHYKHLYSELKKQKDDVVLYIKKNWYSKNTRNINEIVIGDWRIDLLRMLGEIDVED